MLSLGGTTSAQSTWTGFLNGSECGCLGLSLEWFSQEGIFERARLYTLALDFVGRLRLAKLLTHPKLLLAQMYVQLKHLDALRRTAASASVSTLALGQVALIDLYLGLAHLSVARTFGMMVSLFYSRSY